MFNRLCSFEKFVTLTAIGLPVIFVVGLVCLCCCGGIDWEYSKGTRVGKLYKLSEKGLVWKTFEGELDLEMLQSDEGGMTNKIWCFSVPSAEVAAELEKVQGKRVKLEYSQKLVSDFSKGSSSYHVVAFEVLE